MTERNKAFEQLKIMLKSKDNDFNETLIQFLVFNDWFDIEAEIRDEKPYINEEQFFGYYDRFELFFKNRKKSLSKKVKILSDMLSSKFSDTELKLESFFTEFKISKESRYYLLDFLYAYLEKDIVLMTDEDLEKINVSAFNELTKSYGDLMNSFFRWVKENYKTRYIKDYYMGKRVTVDNEAYDEDEYLELLYDLFNPDYIEYNDMLTKAAESKNYVDTWLFMAMHFVCALRDSDLIRIKHPKLPFPPEEVLRQVKEGVFSDDDARMTVASVITRLNYIPFTPHKTEKHQNIPSVKICIPESTEVLIGTLFALAEAHYQLRKDKKVHSFIRPIKTYEQISKYMGDEIGVLFLNSNFKSCSMNKSYLQSIFLLADDILLDAENKELHINGYLLASLARSHKGSFGSFAQTTKIYLKDAKLSGLSPQFVARELFERGVLSSIPSMLLKMITNNEYDTLPVKQQTKLIKALDMTPREVEQAITIYSANKRRAVADISTLFSTDKETRKKEIIEILHRIGNGSAVSKDNDFDCLVTAAKKVCPFPDRSGCATCIYNIGTKSTVFLLASEYKRNLNLYNKAQTVFLKNKYRQIIQETILPAMNDLFICAEEMFGPQIITMFERIVEETVND